MRGIRFRFEYKYIIYHIVDIIDCTWRKWQFSSFVILNCCIPGYLLNGGVRGNSISSGAHSTVYITSVSQVTRSTYHIREIENSASLSLSDVAHTTPACTCIFSYYVAGKRNVIINIVTVCSSENIIDQK